MTEDLKIYMYKVRIKTKYNTIELLVKDVNDPRVKEILNEPWVEEVYIESTEHYKEGELDKCKRLKL